MLNAFKKDAFRYVNRIPWKHRGSKKVKFGKPWGGGGVHEFLVNRVEKGGGRRGTAYGGGGGVGGGWGEGSKGTGEGGENQLGFKKWTLMGTTRRVLTDR